MAYCRMGNDSDVYIYSSVRGGIVCCSCSLSDAVWGDVKFELRSELIKHVEEHTKNGDAVPDGVIETLQEEIEEYGDEA